MCFQTLISQLLDIKQVRKTGGQESLLPSHACNFFIINDLIKNIIDILQIYLIPQNSKRISSAFWFYAFS